MGESSLFKQVPGDYHPHYLVCAFQDLMDSQITHEFLDAVITEISVPTMHLQGVISHPGAELRCDFFGHCGIYSLIGII